MISFKDALVNLFCETNNNGSTEEATVPTAEEQETFDAAVTSEGENVVEMARQQILASQDPCDTDDLPDIGNVLKAVETAGTGDDHQLVRRILSFGDLNPDELIQDGNNRKTAIKNLIQTTTAQNEELKTLKTTANQNLLQAETDAETTCTNAITEINTACDEAIAAEKRRSEEIIAGLRLQAEEAIATAKQNRDETLAGIAEERTGNEAAIRKSAQYAEAVASEGARAIAEIDKLIGYIG